MAVASIEWPEARGMRRLLRSPRFTGELARLDDAHPELIRQTCDLAELPAPSLHEEGRAAWVSTWLDRAGLANGVDSSGSVVAQLPGEEPGILLCAHTDTVFGADEPLTVSMDGYRILGRGVGDNTIGVVALVHLARFLGTLPRTRAVWVAATSGEEGLGDLRGVRSVVDSLAGRIGACLAIEGHFLGQVITTAVGSWRTRLVLRGPGGHSWHDRGGPSAVHGAAAVAAALARLRLPRRPRTSLNVGRIGGGEGVNVIAAEAWLEVDIRSEAQSGVDTMRSVVLDRAKVIAAEQRMDLEMVVLGARPAGALDRAHGLVGAATAALRLVGSAVRLEAASTDANYPASLGIPSVCVGVTRGGGMHTADEWIDAETARVGMRQLAILTAGLAGARP